VSLPKGWKGADILFLDCDSTLSSIEGIDELAARTQTDVSDLTNRAMAGELALEDVYGERLRQIRPSAADFEWLGQRYIETEVEGVSRMIRVLTEIGVECHILSGGLLPGILPFAAHIGIPAERTHAVPYPLPENDSRDAQPGDTDPVELACAHPLAQNGGKPQMIEEICADPLHYRKRRMIVGDGSSDLEAAPNVGLMVGFGGVASRAKVKAGAHLFLTESNMYAVATLAAGNLRAQKIREVDMQLYELGIGQLRDVFAARYMAEHRPPMGYEQPPAPLNKGRIKPEEV
jgi:phosphoserine phosphatase